VVSIYCQDSNSAAAQAALQDAGEPLLISALGEVEIVNAMHLRIFRREISQQQANISLKDFEIDLRAGLFLLRALPQSSFLRARQLACQLTATLGTRSADIIHIAAALELGATSFFSFDQQQRKMAEDTGLKLNPWP
jgi:predicted nucleic acid-binding protein